MASSQAGGSHLHAFGSEREGCHNSAHVSNPACGADGESHGIYNLRHQCHRSHQGIFGRLQKVSAMAAWLKPRGRNYVHVRLLQGDRFVDSGCCSNQDDSPATELIQNMFGGNSINKDEYRNTLVQEDLDLIFETNRLVRTVGGLGSFDTFNMLCPVERGCDEMPLLSRSRLLHLPWKPTGSSQMALL